MTIKFYNHRKQIVSEVKNLNEEEYANVLRVMDKNNWRKQIIDGEEVWVSSKAGKIDV